MIFNERRVLGLDAPQHDRAAEPQQVPGAGNEKQDRPNGILDPLPIRELIEPDEDAPHRHRIVRKQGQLFGPGAARVEDHAATLKA